MFSRANRVFPRTQPTLCVRREMLEIRNAAADAWAAYASTGCIHSLSFPPPPLSLCKPQRFYNAPPPPPFSAGMTGDDLQPIQGDAITYMHVHATLFDSLGTLYVMGLHEEFDAAAAAVVAMGAPRTLLWPTSAFECPTPPPCSFPQCLFVTI